MPFAAYEDLRSGYGDSRGRALTLGSRDGTGTPGLRPAAASSADREGLRVYPSGLIENTALGRNGFLTRDTSSGGSVRVRFAALDHNNAGQIWYFEAGPVVMSGGRPGSDRYTLVVAPFSPDDGWVSVLTVPEAGGEIVMTVRKYPIRVEELDQIPLGQRWDFHRHYDPWGQHRTVARSASELYEEEQFLLSSGARGAAACDLTPGATARKRRALRGAVCPTYHHNPSCCRPDLNPPWINPSCPGIPASITGDGGNPCNCSHAF